MAIHPAATIEKGAKIASNVEVGPGSYIGSCVEIGENCFIGPNVVIVGYTKIGKMNKIFSGAVIGNQTQALAYEGGDSFVQIGDRNTMRECVTINGTEGEGNATIIGNDNLLMAYSHIAHHCTLGNRIVMANSATLGGHVYVGDRVTIGGLAGIHQFVKIGRLSIIGGLSKVVKDVVPFITVDGNPCRVAGLNLIGLKRAGFDREALTRLKGIFKLLFSSDLNTKQAVARLIGEVPGSESREMVDFIQNAKRGIIKIRRRTACYRQENEDGDIN